MDQSQKQIKEEKPVITPLNTETNVNNQLLKPGELVKDRWRVIQKLGGGGFGEIYEAIDTWADAYLFKYPNRYLCPTCLSKQSFDFETTSCTSPKSINNFNSDSGFATENNQLKCCPPRISSAGTTTSGYTMSFPNGIKTNSAKLPPTTELQTPRSLSGKSVPISPMCINCTAEINHSTCEDIYASCSDSGFSNASSLNLEHYQVAIKAESSKQPRQVLRMEVAVLRRLKSREHICQLLGCGKNNRINYMVMTLEGKNLAEIRKSVPKSVFSLNTAFRLVLQCLQALRTLHEVGFLHRDIKPSNFTVSRGSLMQGHPIVKLLDFGLARAYTINGDNKQLRPPRTVAGFRGTVRYASMNAHKQQDLSRYDDIWSLTYMLLEFINGNLPWRRIRDKDEVGRMKVETNNFKLALSMGLPEKIASVWIGQLELMDFFSTPDYYQLEKVINDWLAENVVSKYDWQTEQDPSQSSLINQISKIECQKIDEKEQQTVNQQNDDLPKAPAQIMDPNLPPVTPRKRPPLSSIRRNINLASNSSYNRVKNVLKSTSMNSLNEQNLKSTKEFFDKGPSFLCNNGNTLNSVSKTNASVKILAENDGLRANNQELSKMSFDFATGLTNRSNSQIFLNNFNEDNCFSMNPTSSMHFESSIMTGGSRNSQPYVQHNRNLTPPINQRSGYNHRPLSASIETGSRPQILTQFQLKKLQMYKELFEKKKRNNNNNSPPGERPQTSPAVSQSNNITQTEKSLKYHQVNILRCDSMKNSEAAKVTVKKQRTQSINNSANVGMKSPESPVPKPRKKSLTTLMNEQNSQELIRKAQFVHQQQEENLSTPQIKIVNTVKRPIVKLQRNSTKFSEDSKSHQILKNSGAVKTFQSMKTFQIKQAVKRWPDYPLNGKSSSVKIGTSRTKNNSESESCSVDQSQPSSKQNNNNRLSQYTRAQSADHLASRRTSSIKKEPDREISRIRANSLSVVGYSAASRITSAMNNRVNNVNINNKK